jgi:hypothetical protein
VVGQSVGQRLERAIRALTNARHGMAAIFAESRRQSPISARIAAVLPPLRAVLSVSQRKTDGAGEAAVIRYTVQPTSIPQGDIANMVKKV